MRLHSDDINQRYYHDMEMVRKLNIHLLSIAVIMATIPAPPIGPTTKRRGVGGDYQDQRT
jgi:hypothetical protein